MANDVFGVRRNKETVGEKPQRKKVRKPEDYSEILAGEQPCTNGWSSFAPKPVGMRFEIQDTDEIILLFLRQHPIVNLPWIFIALLMLVAPTFLGPLFSQYLPVPSNLSFILLLGWYLLVSGFMIERFLMWLFDSFIITDERMIDIDFTSLIFKEIDYAQLDKIQDISVRTGGVLYSLLDVGSVFVQTASEVPEFVFNNVAHPNKVAKLLSELLAEEQLEAIEGRVR